MNKLLLSFLTILLFAGCHKEKEEEEEKPKEPEREVTAIYLDKSTLEIRITDTYAFTTTHEPDDLPAPTIQWSSSNSEVATISTTGLLTAVGEGSATITIAAVISPETSLSASCAVTVAKQLATQITLDKTAIHIEEEETDLLSFTLLPNGSILMAATWKSSDEEVAIINQEGTVTAVTPGEATVTLYDAERPEIQATCAITVSKKSPRYVLLSREQLTMRYFQEETLSYTVFPEGAELGDPFWSSGNLNIATVDQDGKVVALSQGVVEIIFTDRDNPHIRAICVVVVELVVDIAFTIEEVTIFCGDETFLTYTISPSGAILEFPLWSSENPNIATVSQEGKVTGVGVGTTTITLIEETDPTISTSCTITVLTVPTTGIRLDQTSIAMTVKDEVTLTYRIEPSNATDKEVEWSSDRESVATVDAYGKVTAIGDGSCNITVKLKNGTLSSTCQIVVTPMISSIVLERESLFMEHGEIFTLGIFHLPTQAIPPASYHWSSSDEWVATVNQSGRVEAQRIGTTTIRVEIPGGIYAICTVSVFPVYGAWREPELLFGSSLSDIEKAENRVKNEISTSTGGFALIYDGESGSGLQYCIYFFGASGMNYCFLAFDDTDAKACDAARGYCEERYKFESESDGKRTYRDKNGIKIVTGIEDIRDREEYQNLTFLEKTFIDIWLNYKYTWFAISYMK